MLFCQEKSFGVLLQIGYFSYITIHSKNLHYCNNFHMFIKITVY